MDPIRYSGKLKKWNAERGFGFIVTDDGQQDVFVHISAFPREGRLPTEGEVLSFALEPDRNGKRSAVRVQRAGSPSAQAVRNPAYVTHRHRPAARPPSTWRTRVIGALIVSSLAFYGYQRFTQLAVPTVPATPVPLSAPAVSQGAPAGFRCDGRTHCSQMTSCREAKLFLTHCPGVAMDGNHDGVPCEQQWCTSPFAN